MRKKKGSLVLAIALAVVLVSCSTGKENKVEEKNNAVSVISKQVEQKPSSGEKEGGKKVTLEGNKGVEEKKTAISEGEKGKAYEVTKTTYKKNGIQINYPQVSGLSDSNKQNTINEMIKNDALQGRNYYKGIDGEISIEINYEIKYKDEALISILYSGVGNVTGAAHPSNLFYTTNINMNKGIRVRLKEFINVNATFVNLFKSDKFKALIAEQANVKETYSSEELLKSFEKADFLGIGTENQSDTFSYFTSNGLGISIPAIHAAGDHAEFEIKYADLNGNVKAENEVWKTLFK